MLSHVEMTDGIACDQTLIFTVYIISVGSGA